MTIEFRSKSHRISSKGISETNLSGRRLAAMLTGGAAALALVLATAIPARADKNDLTKALIAALVVAATLESAFAFCLGCMVFNRLMRWGLIPADVCEDCNDLSRRFAAASS